MKSLEGHPSAADYTAESLFMSKIHAIDNMDSATFDKIYEVLKKEGWRLRTGHWPNMMTLAAYKGNSVLVRHLHKLDPSLLNFGNRAGESPLFVAVEQEKIDVAETLIELGAHINLAIPGPINMIHMGKGIIPYGATCLWVALEQIKSVFWAKLLLRHRGANQLSLSEEGQKILNKAQGELVEEQIQTAAGIEQSHGHFPKEVLGIIHTYV
jgi:hypothetical protein